MSLINVEKTITLDVYDHDTTPSVVKTIQLDTGTRTVFAMIQNSRQDYDIGQNATVSLTVLRPDKTKVQITGQTYVSYAGTDGTMYGAKAELSDVALAVKGNLKAQFKITSGEQELRTEIFTINNGEALDAGDGDWAGDLDGHNLDEMAESIETLQTDMAAVNEDVSDLKEELTAVIDSNVLFESASETVSGGTWALKNIDIDAPVVIGDDYTVLIDSIEGGTAPHLCYIRCMDSSDQAIANVGTGTVTQNIKGTITAVENTAYIRVTLYASTTTALPTGSATYTNVRVVHGTKEVVRIKDGNYTVTVGATNSDYTSLLKALKSTDDNVRIHVKAGTYNIWNEYISEYGQNFWSNYNGYSGNTDKFMRGLWLGNGRTIEFDELAKVVFTPNSEDVTDDIQDYFSVFATSSNNTIINANVKFADCRYAVHDDYGEESGTNLFSHCTFDGAAHFGATIGGGCGKDNVYIFEDCLFLNNVNYYYDINYHNNNGLGATSGKNKIIVKNCYGVGRVRFKWYGSFTDISECIVSGSRFNKIDCVAHESEPNSIENMALYQFNNTVDIT